MEMMVVGATGFVGGIIANNLAKQGTGTSALVRHGRAHAKAQQLLSAGIDIVQGDLANQGSLEDIFKDVEVVICTATSMPTAANDGLHRVDHDGVLALIDAAERHDVRRFVYTSYSGNVRADSPLETAKRSCENRLLASRMEVVILRPSFFLEVWLSPALGFDPRNGDVRIYGSGDAIVSYISAMDVAEFGVAAATRIYPEKKTILELGGPEAISQLDAVRIFEGVLQRKLSLQFVSEEALRLQHQSSDPLQKSFGALMLGYAHGDEVVRASVVAQNHGIQLGSVSEYALKWLGSPAQVD
jgi:NADH dehydrogenase